MQQVISLEIKKRVGYIIMNRPKANCYEINFHQQLIQCIDDANLNSEVKVIVLTSALDKFFCAGADIKVFEANSVEANKEMVKQAQLVANKLSKSSKPTIAAVCGHALGGGLELMLACDMRLGAQGNYLLGLPEIKLGLMPGNGGTQRLVRLVGTAKASELLLTGDSFGPDEAMAMGLFNQLYTPADFNSSVEAFCEKLAKGPSQAMAAIKLSITNGVELSLAEGLELESKLVDPLYDTDDAKEGYQAFLDKRNPIFK